MAMLGWQYRIEKIVEARATGCQSLRSGHRLTCRPCPRRTLLPPQTKAQAQKQQDKAAWLMGQEVKGANSTLVVSHRPSALCQHNFSHPTTALYAVRRIPRAVSRMPGFLAVFQV